MSEEEKEAIENIKALKILFEIDDKKDFEATPSVQKEMAKDLRTLLNLLEKLQKENEKALAEYMKWQKQELGQKDKIIDLMAETINNHDIDEDICKQMGQKANCNEFEDTEKCKECIKQYFERKVENGN